MEKSVTTETKNKNKPFYKKWWGILLAILFFPIFITWYVWTKTSWNRWLKVGITVVAGILLIAIVQSGDNETITTTQSDEQVTEQIELEYSQEDRELVLAFEKQVYAIENKYKPVMTAYSSTMNSFGDNNVSIFDVYSATTKAQEASESMRREYSSLKPSDKLPKDIKNKLLEVSSEMGTAYFTKVEAFKAIKKFLDDQKPSYFQQAQDENSLADKLIVGAMAKMLSAQLMVGIDIVGD